MSEPTVDEVIVKILRDEIDALRRKLEIATEALEFYACGRDFWETARDALDAMKGGG